MRVRVLFGKNAAMRFTGHLDLQNTWMRIFRRARIALEHSQGYHPLPKIQLASALPLGFTSRAEVMDVWIAEALSLPEIRERIQAALPPGIDLQEVREVPPGAPKIQSVLKFATYRVALPLDQTPPDLSERVSAFLARGEILVERRGKGKDIRPLVDRLEVARTPAGAVELRMRLSAREGATGRPDEILPLLGIDPGVVVIERVALEFAA